MPLVAAFENIMSHRGFPERFCAKCNSECLSRVPASALEGEGRAFDLCGAWGHSEVHIRPNLTSLKGQIEAMSWGELGFLSCS